MLHSSNCESSQQGSSIPLSQPRISLNPVIPTVISDIPCILSIPNLAPILLFIPEYRPSIKANPASRKIYWGPSKRSRKSRLLSLASRIPYPVSRAYFQYQVSPLYCFKIPKPGLQMGRIPDPEKPFDDPQLFPLDFRILLCNESQIKWFLFSCILIPEYDQSNAPYSKHEKRFRNNSASIYYNRKISLPFLSDHAFSVH